MGGPARHKRGRRFRTVAILSLCLLISYCQWHDYRARHYVSPAVTVDWQLDAHGTKYVTLKIPPGYNGTSAHRERAFNRAVYGNASPPTHDYVEEIQVLHALWPGLEPQTSRNRDEFFKVPGWGRRVTIFIRSGAVQLHPDLGDEGDSPRPVGMNQFEWERKIQMESTQTVCYTSAPALKEPTCHVFDPLPEKEPRFGLKHWGIDLSKTPGFPLTEYLSHDDVYIPEAPELAEKIFIHCTPDEMPLVSESSPTGRFSPRCAQIFLYAPLNGSVEISYHRDFLKDWKKIQSEVEHLLASFIVESAVENP